MSEWESGDVPTTGGRLHYHRTGAGRPPVLLLHGFSDNGLCWTRVATALQDRYDLIMPDARGHGESDPPGDDDSPKLRADDVAAFVTALGLGQVAVIGHSMGGSSAALLAAEHPETVACAVLEDPGWRDGGPRVATADRARSMREMQATPVEEIIRQGRKNQPGWDEVEFPAWAESKRQLSPLVYERSTTLQQRPWREVAARIQAPTLLLTADTSRGAIVDEKNAEEAVKLLAKGRTTRITGAGHNIRRENFPDFLSAVTGFLGEVYA
ncbi:MAG TPA: alpha/beta hydrolase [Candidatus Dormibacteraeota bacterium]|jgi:pimeloyl-ACP methyl ester carboxylesterase|nr:alpha/beta hydrolase [Candidatus Dormibacteraeota bacterium]